MRNNKASASDDMNKNKEEINIRIDEIEKNNMDWCD
jgi:chaperonin cofactor prefoldin